MANLTQSDLAEVKTFLFSVRNKWYNIGLYLKLDFDKLDEIKAKYGADNDECLREMLKIWLKSYRIRPTWGLLAKALMDRSIEEDELAELAAARDKAGAGQDGSNEAAIGKISGKSYRGIDDDYLSSDDSTPSTSNQSTSPSPSTPPLKKAKTSYRKRKHGSRLKRNKGKRKCMAVSPSASSSASHDSTDASIGSYPPTRVTSKRYRKHKMGSSKLPSREPTKLQLKKVKKIFQNLSDETSIMEEIKDEIKKFSGMAEDVQLQCSTSKQLSHPLVQYKTYLQSYYKRCTIALDDKLCIAPSSEFINLALVKQNSMQRKSSESDCDDELCIAPSSKFINRSESLDLDSIVTPDSQFVLVEGDAGMGKSTLCWELCRKWDDLKSLQHYKIVVLQKLRELRLQKATTLHEIFRHDNSNLSKHVEEEMYRCEGEGVLLILDGFDEMPNELIRDKESLIMRVISGACLPKATRIVTSRPSALHHKESVFPQKYRHIETLGFTDVSIEQYAEKAFPKNSNVLEHFKEFILSNPIIKSLMYIPVNCAILARVYKDIRKSRKLMPKTMTQLYTTLVLVLIKRHMIERGEWDNDHRVPGDLNGLPSEFTAPLKTICALSYRGLFKKKGQLVFSDDEVGENFEHLGLLSEAKEMYVSEGARSTYSFSHKSIQEFLAAYCVAHYPDVSNKLTSYLLKMAVVRSHNMFTLFLCGMVGFKDEIMSMESLHRGLIPGAYFCCCFYEAQDHDNSYLPSTITHWINLSTALDAYAFGYCLTHARFQFGLDRIGTPLEPLMSCLHGHIGTLPGSIDCLQLRKSLSSLFVKNLFEVFRSKGRPISKISINREDSGDIEWLSGLIPILHFITDLSLSLYPSLENDYRVYQLVQQLKLTTFSLECPGCTKKGAQELCNVISTMDLEEVTLKYSNNNSYLRECSFFDSSSVIDQFASYSVVEAAMASPTIKKLTTNFGFQVFKNLNIQDVIFDVAYRCLDTATTHSCALDIRRILVSMWHCINGKESSSFRPLRSITLKIHFVRNCSQYNFIGILNEYMLRCKSTKLIVEDTYFYRRLQTQYNLLKLCAAFRRKQYISHSTLKKAQSFEDLRSGPSLVEFKPISGVRKFQSCPDLSALTNMHPKLQKIIMRKKKLSPLHPVVSP